jgi:hypothetical protein
MWKLARLTYFTHKSKRDPSAEVQFYESKGVEVRNYGEGEQDYAKAVCSLLNEGWEPFSTDAQTDQIRFRMRMS